ncbi:Flavin reductase like domain protein [Corynebacterium glaucum]|uniref:Flavin reductase like domain protein n=1 Tax=Corynebacterium glaucum TaxID=187491 RepID=A0A1Q2HZJ4_9CORY|nr:flavin reductase family protein [Corynebacterium glaucum]AQQ16261.1 Flavin reductase like domain protein [Corynebacterium glaucum]
MKWHPKTEPNPLPYSPFKSSTVPRPIGWLSSVDPEGRENIAPYSQWQNLTFDPPMVMFSANQYPDGRRKDTVLNAEQTGWFVWNMATYDLREEVNKSAMALPHEESEWDHLEVTKIYADNYPVPMIAESPIKFECRYKTTLRIPGNTPVGTIDLVVADVETIHINEDFLDADGKIGVLKIRPIARMGYFDYTVVTEKFEMRVPGSDSAAQAGLEGSA